MGAVQQAQLGAVVRSDIIGHDDSGTFPVRAIARGAILDVLVDIRPESATFGQWEAFELSDENHHVLYCPESFGHGFCVLSDIADVLYKTSAYYDAELEGGFAYDDPAVGVEWPQGLELQASARDLNAPSLAQLRDTFRAG